MNLKSIYYPPASKASRKVANLTERKNPHTPVYGVKEFVCLSVCPSVCYIYKFPTTERVNISAPLAARPVFVHSIYLTFDNYSASPHSQRLWNLPHKFHLYLIYKLNHLYHSFTCTHLSLYFQYPSIFTMVGCFLTYLIGIPFHIFFVFA